MIRYMRILWFALMLCSFYGFGQDWECEDCPKRHVGLFDLDVWVENPLDTDPSPAGQKLYQTWVELFQVAGGIHHALFENDPSKECIHYYDGQMAMISGLDEPTYQQGNNQTSLPPAAGTMDEVDYWITGIIANQESDGLTLITVYVQASGTGETVAEATDIFDGTLSGFEAGKNIAQQLMPLMGKIRDFEKRKRDEVDIVAIDPDGKGATMELKPEKEKINFQEEVNTTVKLIDCDGVPLKNIEVRLKSRGGSFDPKVVNTDSRGMAKATFTAGTNPGKFAQPFEFDFRFPYTFEMNTSGGEGFITIEPMQYDASITITGKYNRELRTSIEDNKKENVSRRNINESTLASTTIYLTLIETQDMPIFNQTWQYYKPLNVNISAFNYNYKEHKYMAGPNYETNVEITRYVKSREIKEKEKVTEAPWMLVIDNKTEKALKIIPAGYNIFYEVIEEEKMTSVIQTSQGPKRDANTTTKTRERAFELGPVEEEADDPTTKMSDNWMNEYLERQGIEMPPGIPVPPANPETIKKIHPDILVSSGDGKTSFGGRGERPIVKELEGGIERIKLSYNWEMTIKKKE